MPICSCGTRYLTRNTDKCVLCRHRARRVSAAKYRQQVRVRAQMNQQTRKRYAARQAAIRALKPSRDQVWADILADVQRRKKAA